MNPLPPLKPTGHVKLSKVDAFTVFYASPSPLNALNLAIADIRAQHGQSDYLDMLRKAANQLERRPALIDALIEMRSAAYRQGEFKAGTDISHALTLAETALEAEQA